jgi:hypothetical protein
MISPLWRYVGREVEVLRCWEGAPIRAYMRAWNVVPTPYSWLVVVVVQV